MPSAAKTGLGIGTSIAGGAATGAAFGPIGAGIGAGVGGLLGLIGAGQAGEDEEELKRKRDQARKMAVVQALRNRASSLGAPTDRVDMEMTQQGINQQYDQGMKDINNVGAQDFMPLIQNLASVGGAASKGNWMGGAKQAAAGAPVRNADLYGNAGTTGLRESDDPYGPLGGAGLTFRNPELRNR